MLAKTRSDIKLDKMVKKHEFSVTPRSLFALYGALWKCLDKSSFLTGIEDMLDKEDAVTSYSTLKDVLVIDCMGVVNQLKISGNVTTLADLADQFYDRVDRESRGFSILALAFDRYETLKPSLKQQTWDSRSKKQQVPGAI